MSELVENKNTKEKQVLSMCILNLFYDKCMWCSTSKEM